MKLVVSQGGNELYLKNMFSKYIIIYSNTFLSQIFFYSQIYSLLFSFFFFALSLIQGYWCVFKKNKINKLECTWYDLWGFLYGFCMIPYNRAVPKGTDHVPPPLHSKQKFIRDTNMAAKLIYTDGELFVFYNSQTMGNIYIYWHAKK